MNEVGAWGQGSWRRPGFEARVQGAWRCPQESREPGHEAWCDHGGVVRSCQDSGGGLRNDWGQQHSSAYLKAARRVNPKS